MMRTEQEIRKMIADLRKEYERTRSDETPGNGARLTRIVDQLQALRYVLGEVPYLLKSQAQTTEQ